MTWREIKRAAETAGISDNDELVSIECERLEGDKRLHIARSGKALKLREFPDESKLDVNGCAV